MWGSAVAPRLLLRRACDGNDTACKHGNVNVRKAKWSAGAYSSQPQVERVDHTYRGTASIECWLGTPDELLGVLEAADLFDVGTTSVDLAATVTWLVGTRSRFRNASDVHLGLTQEPSTKARTIELRGNRGSIEFVLHARRNQIPGLSFEITGADQTVVADVCKDAYQRMMIGYVDRLGGWRSIAFMLLAVAPIPVFGQLSTGSAWSSILALICSVVWVALFLVAIGPRLFAATPCTLVAEVDRSAAVRQAIGSALSVRVSVRTWLVGTVAGIVTLSVLANLLTDAVKSVFQSLF